MLRARLSLCFSPHCNPQAPGGHELAADYWELVGSSPAGGAENLVNEESHIDVQLDQRHMMLRGDTVREREGCRKGGRVGGREGGGGGGGRRRELDGYNFLHSLPTFICSFPRYSGFVQL